MRVLKATALVVVLVLTLAAAQAKTKKPDKLPAVLNSARYVYVEAVDGGQFDPRLHPEDRKAIADVYAAFQDWHRYELTARREQAELIVVVRKGHLTAGDLGVNRSALPAGALGRSTDEPAGGVESGGEAGSPYDLFEVILPGPNNAQAARVWSLSREGGLDAPKLALFQEFKTAVERDYPAQPASQPQKP
jgi:hypothetical protein